ncbi:MAG TPA: SEC-C domain-containing protein [Spirochaetota bacterium]|nr:SEC-C domain-containing protein [Spirochaetota bacterium]HPU87988.1 SEC-C domain-containing protein [Spirochaetota bacterium]
MKVNDFMSTTGRNEPCPCGSGKKYKHCCLQEQDNVIPFPGVGFSDDNFKRYEAFAESWDDAKGPVPTFMEFLGRPNAATESMKKLKQDIGDRIFESKEELQAEIDRRMLSANTSPREEFLGLSPTQMRDVLHKSFLENTELVALDKSVDRELLEGVPVLAQCRYVMQTIYETEPGYKPTQLGNFPRVLVQAFFERFIKEDALLKDPPMREDDVLELTRLRFFLKDMGLMRKQQGRFRLTKKAEQILARNDPFELYSMLFDYLASSINWLYGTRYPEDMVFIQHALVFNLLVLKRAASEFVPEQQLVDVFKRAFPTFESDMRAMSDFDMISSGFCSLFLRRFAAVCGLVELRGDALVKLKRETEYRTTRLFDAVLVWKV